MDDGVEPVGMVTFPSQTLEPDAIGQEQVVECPMHALEERSNVATIVSIVERECRFIEPGVSPPIVGRKPIEVCLHAPTPIALRNQRTHNSNL
jgi:hypothetical protein